MGNELKSIGFWKHETSRAYRRDWYKSFGMMPSQLEVRKPVASKLKSL